MAKKKTIRRRSTRARSDARRLESPEWNLSNEEIERSLLTGENAGLLEDYFGEENYRELQQLAREAAAQRVRGGPRVLILPGILGSTIGRKRFGPFHDILWFDPIDVFNGRLESLALKGTPSTWKAVGVVEFAYLRLKLNLIRDGYDADFHPYDWRLGIELSARDLLQRLSKESSVLVNLVAHSMGGLVARAAMGIGKREKHAGQKKIRRVVMVGTPNFGSFAPVQVIRATYETVKKVAQLDRKHDAAWLASNVFNTFPSLYEMLPAPEKFSAIDLYDADSWPTSGPGPRQPLLSDVARARRNLAPASEKIFVIAGVNLNTTVGISGVNGEFIYQVSRDGDGTVPLDLALLPDARTWYIEESHGSLPNNPLIARATAEILDRGDTEALPDQYIRTREAPRLVRESELRVSPFEEARPLSQRETRHAFDEFASPNFRSPLSVPRSPVDGSAAVDLRRTDNGERTTALVVGRRRQHRIDVRLALGSITEVDARALVLGLFRDVTPGGAARALDERLGGTITDLTLRRMFSSGVGEIFMLPAARSGLRTELIAFVGLGSFDRFSEEVQETAAENAIRTLVRTNIEEFATVLIGAGSGSTAERAVKALLTGFVRGLIEADVDHRFRRIILCERDPQVFQEMKQELYRLAATELLDAVEITFDEVMLPLAAQPVAPTRQPLVTGGEQPVYLLARVERESARQQVLRASVLTAGAKAAVITGSVPFSARELERIIAPITRQRFTRESLVTIGTELSSSLLAEPVLTVLTTMRDRHMVVVHDSESSRIPWEVLCIDSWFPAADAGMSHRYVADNLAVAKWLEQRREDETLEVLLVVNPTEDLEGAEKEGDRVRSLLAGTDNVQLDEYRGRDATKPALLAAFRSGKYDVVHYAGHALFAAAAPALSGLLCNGGNVLSGADLVNLGSLPTLVFFNACESARVRARRAASRVPRLESVSGVAEAFLRGGVANFLGTYWPVGDEAAETFSRAFYERLLSHDAIGPAVQAGRRAVAGLGRQRGRDWADYLLYGDPQFVLKK